MMRHLLSFIFSLYLIGNCPFLIAESKTDATQTALTDSWIVLNNDEKKFAIAFPANPESLINQEVFGALAIHSKYVYQATPNLKLILIAAEDPENRIHSDALYGKKAEEILKLYANLFEAKPLSFFSQETKLIQNELFSLDGFPAMTFTRQEEGRCIKGMLIVRNNQVFSLGYLYESELSPLEEQIGQQFIRSFHFVSSQKENPWQRYTYPKQQISIEFPFRPQSDGIGQDHPSGMKMIDLDMAQSYVKIISFPLSLFPSDKVQQLRELMGCMSEEEIKEKMKQADLKVLSNTEVLSLSKTKIKGVPAIAAELLLNFGGNIHHGHTFYLVRYDLFYIISYFQKSNEIDQELYRKLVNSIEFLN